MNPGIVSSSSSSSSVLELFFLPTERPCCFLLYRRRRACPMHGLHGCLDRPASSKIVVWRPRAKSIIRLSGLEKDPNCTPVAPSRARYEWSGIVGSAVCRRSASHRFDSVRASTSSNDCRQPQPGHSGGLLSATRLSRSTNANGTTDQAALPKETAKDIEKVNYGRTTGRALVSAYVHRCRAA